jgi:hypothetical protein
VSSEHHEPERPATKADVQAELGVRAAGEAGIDIGVARFADGGLNFLHQQGAILVRDAYLDRVGDVVGGGRPLDGLVNGVTLYSLEEAEISGAIAALEEIDRQLGVGVATPNHALSISPVHTCPATEPEEVPAGAGPDPGVCAGRRGSGVFIYVIDTGLLDDAPTHPWLAGVTGEEDPLPDRPPVGVPQIPDDTYTGHGTFVAGVARCMAPLSEVRVVRDFSAAGILMEADVVKRLDEALNLGPDVINLSAGGTSRNDLPLLGFEAFWERYRHYKGVVLVAAAGNNGDRRPFWPAAFPQVVSVGALAANWRSRASFSDYGGWVDVYAPGEGLVNAYATGSYVCREPPHAGEHRQFQGMARWSGTSFSTSLVAGLVAARMSRTGENGRQAADALVGIAQAQALPGAGAVLWPCETDDNARDQASCRDHRHRCERC